MATTKRICSFSCDSCVPNNHSQPVQMNKLLKDQERIEDVNNANQKLEDNEPPPMVESIENLSNQQTEAMKKVTFRTESVGIRYRGNRIIGITPNSQAAKAGIRIGWLIIEINGKVQTNDVDSIKKAIENAKDMEHMTMVFCQNFQELGGLCFNKKEYPEATFWFFQHKMWRMDGQEYSNVDLALYASGEKWEGFAIFLQQKYNCMELTPNTKWHVIEKAWNEKFKESGDLSYENEDFSEATFWYFQHKMYRLDGEEYKSMVDALGRAGEKWEGFDLFLFQYHTLGILKSTTEWYDVHKLWNTQESLAGTIWNWNGCHDITLEHDGFVSAPNQMNGLWYQSEDTVVIDWQNAEGSCTVRKSSDGGHLISSNNNGSPNARLIKRMPSLISGSIWYWNNSNNVRFRYNGVFSAPDYKENGTWNQTGDTINIDWGNFGRYTVKISTNGRKLEGTRLQDGQVYSAVFVKKILFSSLTEEIGELLNQSGQLKQKFDEYSSDKDDTKAKEIEEQIHNIQINIAASQSELKIARDKQTLKEEIDAKKKIEMIFDHKNEKATPLGFKLTGNKVSSVEKNSQAEGWGVQSGWEIVKVNNEYMRNDTKIIKENINKTYLTSQPTSIHFCEGEMEKKKLNQISMMKTTMMKHGDMIIYKTISGWKNGYIQKHNLNGTYDICRQSDDTIAKDWKVQNIRFREPRAIRIRFQPNEIGIHCIENIITRIEPGSQAEKSGVSLGWSIFEINMKTNFKSGNDIKGTINQHMKKNDLIYITFQKSRKGVTLIFQPGEIGIELKGNAVQEVNNNTQADRAGVRRGWIIIGVNGEEKLVDQYAIRTAIRKTNRNGQTTYITFMKKVKGNRLSVPISNKSTFLEKKNLNHV